AHSQTPTTADSHLAQKEERLNISLERNACKANTQLSGARTHARDRRQADSSSQLRESPQGKPYAARDSAVTTNSSLIGGSVRIVSDLDRPGQQEHARGDFSPGIGNPSHAG
ncbi:MAG: hypothetical protein ABW292_24240, partial [Vicinamibacterales bacterium]